MKLTKYRCLKNERVGKPNGYHLKTIQPENIEQIRIWRNAQTDVLRQQHLITPEEQQAYFDQHIWPTLTDEHPKQILLSFFKNDKIIGYGGLVHVNWDSKHAEISFLADPTDNNYEENFTNFLELLCQVAFLELKLHRLYTETFAYRTAHVQILEKAGFKPEGKLREHTQKRNQWQDSLLHGLLAREFLHEK